MDPQEGIAFRPLEVDFGPPVVNSVHLGVDFWIFGGWVWAPESQISASGSRFLACGRRIGLWQSNFRQLRVDLGTLGVVIRPLGINFRLESILGL